MNELGMNKWLVYYRYMNMEGHMVEDNKIISLWANELELDIILKKLNPRIEPTRIVIMNMIKLK